MLVRASPVPSVVRKKKPGRHLASTHSHAENWTTLATHSRAPRAPPQSLDSHTLRGAAPPCCDREGGCRAGPRQPRGAALLQRAREPLGGDVRDLVHGRQHPMVGEAVERLAAKEEREALRRKNTAMALRPRTPPGLGLSCPQPDTNRLANLGALLSSPVLGVRLPTALQVLQVLQGLPSPSLPWVVCFLSFFLSLVLQGDQLQVLQELEDHLFNRQYCLCRVCHSCLKSAGSFSV